MLYSRLVHVAIYEIYDEDVSIVGQKHNYRHFSAAQVQ